MRQDGEFDHDRLEAYQLARAAARALEPVLSRVPRGFAELVTQLRKASLSVMLNIAEGSGEFAPLEKARFYRISRPSCDECCGVLDYLVDAGVLDAEDIRACRLLYWRTAGALVRLIQSVEGRSPRSPTPTSSSARR